MDEYVRTWMQLPGMSYPCLKEWGEHFLFFNWLRESGKTIVIGISAYADVKLHKIWVHTLGKVAELLLVHEIWEAENYCAIATVAIIRIVYELFSDRHFKHEGENNGNYGLNVSRNFELIVFVNGVWETENWFS